MSAETLSLFNWVRVRASDALGTTGGPKVVEAVFAFMKDEDEFVRRCAIALERIIDAVPLQQKARITASWPRVCEGW
ncbi:hypothetical protein NKDENANG_00084 [Candidatus Entotheonellaceae bacterium PAL068K]